MRFESIRLIADDLVGMVDFYERVTETRATWLNDAFAELRVGSTTIAIGSTRTVPLFGENSADAGANRTAILEFLVDDVDAEYARLREWLTTFVNEPTTMPWGNRSLLLRDPEGSLVNLFTPATPDSRAKFGMIEL